MKKLFAVLVAVILSVTALFALAACREKSEVEKIIDAAEKMSLEELEEAAKAEFQAAGVKFDAASSTSGVGNVLKAFKAKYDWFDYETFSTIKDSDSYTAIEGTVVKGNFWKDFALLQEGASLQGYVDEYYLLSYNPTKKAGDGISVPKADQSPMTGLYINKLFLYNKANNPNMSLTNVWQLTGKDGANGKKGVYGISLQDPGKEAINMSFLIQMTSKDVCKDLEKAYESYFGTKYKAQKDYKNIGYYFIAEFLGNVKNRHTSDTDVSKGDLVTDTKGFVYTIGLNKLKSYTGNKEDVFVTGVTGDMEGFNGFMYKGWLTIPSTSRLPYTACLFTRYLLTEEGFKAGWKDAGYYSANDLVPINGTATTDNTIADWRSKLIFEDPSYVASVYADVSAFVTSLWKAGAPAA